MCDEGYYRTTFETCECEHDYRIVKFLLMTFTNDFLNCTIIKNVRRSAMVLSKNSGSVVTTYLPGVKLINFHKMTTS